MIDMHWNYFSLANFQNKRATSVYSAFECGLILRGKKLNCVHRVTVDNWHHLKALLQMAHNVVFKFNGQLTQKRLVNFDSNIML